MEWKKLIESCEDVLPGSGKILNQIKENKEAFFSERTLEVEEKIYKILPFLFLWGETSQKHWAYWRDLWCLLKERNL